MPEFSSWRLVSLSHKTTLGCIGTDGEWELQTRGGTGRERDEGARGSYGVQGAVMRAREIAGKLAN